MTMRKLIAIIAVVAVCGSVLTGCNEKPKSYRFVKVMPDGKELVENITAHNDTDALKQYLSAMEKVIIENMEKPEAERQDFMAMYVVSPDGYTLNTNKALLETVVNSEAGVTTIQPGTMPAKAAPSGPKMTPLRKLSPSEKKEPSSAPAK